MIFKRKNWRNSLNYTDIRWNRKSWYKAKHLSRLLYRLQDSPDLPDIVDAYHEILDKMPTYDRLNHKLEYPGWNGYDTDIPF